MEVFFLSEGVTAAVPREVLSMILYTVFMIALFLGVVRFALRMTWGAVKFLFGLSLFFFCPLLFFAAAMLGLLGSAWLPILIVALICGSCFRRC